MQLTQYKCFFSCQKQIELLSVLIAKFFVKSSSSKWPMVFLLKFQISTAIHFYEPVSWPIMCLCKCLSWTPREKLNISHSGDQVTALYLLQFSFLVLLLHIKYLVMFLTSFSAFVSQKQGKWLMHHQPAPSVSQEDILQFPTNQGLQFGNCFICCGIFNLQGLSSLSREGHQTVRGMWHLRKQ